MTLEERFLDSPRRLRYLIGGEGPPLLLIHGFLGSAENFEAWFDEVSRHRTIIVPDLPGFGDTQALRSRHTCAALARAVQPLIDELGLQRFDLGGLCLGAGVAFEIAARNQGRVDRLVLHTPLLSPRVVRSRFHRQVALMTAPGVFTAVSWLSRRRIVSDLYKRLLVEGGDVDFAAAEMNFRNQQRAHPQAARQWLRDGLRRDDAALLDAHDGESLVIVARDDRILDVPHMQTLLARMPHVHVAIVDDAGHGWNEAFVRRQLDVITAFLDGRPLPALVDTTEAA